MVLSPLNPSLKLIPCCCHPTMDHTHLSHNRYGAHIYISGMVLPWEATPLAPHLPLYIPWVPSLLSVIMVSNILPWT